MGIPSDPFGSIMITNIGSLGLQEAFVPLVPYSRVPLLVAMGAVEDAPVVEDGAIVPGKTMRVCATFDHRVLDGAHAAVMARTLRAWMENPFEHFDDVDAVNPEAAPAVEG
jgi:pyruvate dehydrogenase E2 component (dihydrolipoamide acetyltransferase)